MPSSKVQPMRREGFEEGGIFEVGQSFWILQPDHCLRAIVWEQYCTCMRWTQLPFWMELRFWVLEAEWLTWGQRSWPSRWVGTREVGADLGEEGAPKDTGVTAEEARADAIATEAQCKSEWKRTQRRETGGLESLDQGSFFGVRVPF
jgi:hypothetical protein